MFREPPAGEDVERRLRGYFSTSDVVSSPPDFGAMANRAVGFAAPIASPRRSAFRAAQRRWMYVAAGVLLAFGALRASFYYVPAWQERAYAAVGTMPGSRFVIGSNDPGLLQLATTGRIPVMNASATDQGFTLHLVGAYTDGVRTTLFLKVTSSVSHGTYWPSMQSVVLTDQFGHRYQPTNAMWNTDSNAGNFQFSGVPAWELPLGLRLHLTVSSLEALNPHSGPGQTVTGSWRIAWGQPAQGSQKTLHPNTKAAANGVSLRLLAVDLSPSATKFAVATDAAPINTQPAISPGKKPVVPQPYVLDEANGKHLPMLFWGGGSYGVITTGHFMSAPVNHPGKYRLIVPEFNGHPGPWTLPFTVP